MAGIIGGTMEKHPQVEIIRLIPAGLNDGILFHAKAQSINTKGAKKNRILFESLCALSVKQKSFLTRTILHHTHSTQHIRHIGESMLREQIARRRTAMAM